MDMTEAKLVQLIFLRKIFSQNIWCSWTLDKSHSYYTSTWRLCYVCQGGRLLPNASLVYIIILQSKLPNCIFSFPIIFYCCNKNTLTKNTENWNTFGWLFTDLPLQYLPLCVCVPLCLHVSPIKKCQKDTNFGGLRGSVRLSTVLLSTIAKWCMRHCVMHIGCTNIYTMNNFQYSGYCVNKMVMCDRCACVWEKQLCTQCSDSR